MPSDALRRLYTSFIDGIYGKQEHPDDFILSSDTLDAQASLAVYRGSVRGGLTQALGDIYPATKSCLGENFFDAMANRFIDQYPSRSPSLDDYGEQLPAFMSEFKPLIEMPYLFDLAKVEWAWHRAFHAPQEDALDVQSIQSVPEIDQPSLEFELNKSVSLISTDFPIAKIWHQNRGFEPLEEVDLSQGGEYLLVWRKGYESKVEVIDELAFAFLQQMKKGENLGTIYEYLLSKNANNEQLVSTFITILSAGWLTGFQN